MLIWNKLSALYLQYILHWSSQGSCQGGPHCSHRNPTLLTTTLHDSGSSPPHLWEGLSMRGSRGWICEKLAKVQQCQHHVTWWGEQQQPWEPQGWSFDMSQFLPWVRPLEAFPREGLSFAHLRSRGNWSHGSRSHTSHRAKRSSPHCAFRPAVGSSDFWPGCWHCCVWGQVALVEMLHWQLYRDSLE